MSMGRKQRSKLRSTTARTPVERTEQSDGERAARELAPLLLTRHLAADLTFCRCRLAATSAITKARRNESPSF